MFHQRHHPAHSQYPALTARASIYLVTAILTPSALAEPAELLATQPEVWTAAEAVDRDRFGTAVDLDADRAVIGASATDGPTDRAGAVYLFQHTGSGWQETTVLRLEGVGAAARFGSDVALEGDWLAAGAFGVTAGAGAIYLFRHETNAWQQQHRFQLPETQDFTFFGASLDMHGDLLISGAPGYDDGASDSGIVMVYERSDDGSWSEADQLQLDNPREGTRLGSSVALHGNRALVGADGVGAAYLFERNNGDWSRIASFSEDVGESSGFGASVALADGLVLIGAPFAEASGESRGAAFLYAEQEGSWEQQTGLRSDTPNRSDQFGAAVALTGGMALVSSPRDDADARDAGAVFVYAPDDGRWALNGRLSRPDPGEYDEFGGALAVDIDSGAAAVGTPADAPPGTDDGYPGTVSTYRW